MSAFLSASGRSPPTRARRSRCRRCRCCRPRGASEFADGLDKLLGLLSSSRPAVRSSAMSWRASSGPSSLVSLCSSASDLSLSWTRSRRTPCAEIDEAGGVRSFGTTMVSPTTCFCLPSRPVAAIQGAAARNVDLRDLRHPLRRIQQIHHRRHVELESALDAGSYFQHAGSVPSAGAASCRVEYNGR